MSSLLSHGAGISLQSRQLLDVAAKSRSADILHLLFFHGARAESELVFSTLEASLGNDLNSASWTPVFQVRERGEAVFLVKGEAGSWCVLNR